MKKLNLLRNTSAMEATEIAVIIVAVILVIIGAFRLLGINIASAITSVAGAI
jgi:Flp pilus assembly pilin Flp